MKSLVLIIMLVVIGIALPVSASAKVDPATLDRQRAANKIRLEKALIFRSGKSNSAAVDRERRMLKLDAISPSPRRGAKKYFESPVKTYE